MKKCYSTNDEDFHYDKLGELFDDLDSDGELVLGRAYYEADCREITASDFTGKRRIESILEQFDEDLYEEIGEIADNDFTGVTDEAKAELASFLSAWIEKHVNVGRYWKIIGKTRPMQVTAEDLRDADPAKAA